MIGLLVTAGVSIAGFMDEPLRETLLARSTYYFIFAMTIAWGVSLYLTLRDIDVLRRYIIPNKYGILLAAILTIVMFTGVTPGFRVLGDETNIISVSRSMAYDRSIYNTIMAKWDSGVYQPLVQLMPIRPVLFQFLISLFHNLFGYTYFMGFVVNGWLLFILLSLAFVFFREHSGISAAVASMFLLIGHPLMGISATSSGYEICNLLFFVILLLTLKYYWETKTETSFTLLWLTLIMLANIRHEGMIYLLTIPLGLIIFKAIPTSLFKYIFSLTGISSLLFIPRILQLLHTKGAYENHNDSLLSIYRIPANAWDLMSGLFMFDFKYPYSPVLTIVALFSFLWIVFRRSPGKYFKSPVTISAVISLTIYLGIMLSHFLADPLGPHTFRLFLLPTVMLAIVPVILIRELPKHAAGLLLVISVLNFLLFNSIAIKYSVVKPLTNVKDTARVFSYLDEHADRHTLLIADRPGQYGVRNLSTVDFIYANINGEGLLKEFSDGVFSRILVVQYFDYRKNYTGSQLRSLFVLTPVYEFKSDNQRRVVISTVKNRNNFVLQ